jgi:hypothetical protein
MARLIKIGERIINLDTVAFVERTQEHDTEVVTLYYHQMRRFKRPVGQVPKGTEDDPIIEHLNMNFLGADARFVWDKLCEVAETWGLPGEIEPSPGGGWPKKE